MTKKNVKKTYQIEGSRSSSKSRSPTEVNNIFKVIIALEDGTVSKATTTPKVEI